MSVSERYYKRLRGQEKKKIADISRKSRMSDMEAQRPVKNYSTTHGAYGRPLPRQKEEDAN